MTNPIGAGTANMTTNMLEGQSLLLGRLAHQEGQSKGDLVKHLIREALEMRDPQLAAKWDRIKATRYAQAVTLCFVGSLVVWQALLGHIDARRAPRPLRTARKEMAA